MKSKSTSINIDNDLIKLITDRIKQLTLYKKALLRNSTTETEQKYSIKRSQSDAFNIVLPYFSFCAKHNRFDQSK